MSLGLRGCQGSQPLGVKGWLGNLGLTAQALAALAVAPTVDTEPTGGFSARPEACA